MKPTFIILLTAASGFSCPQMLSPHRRAMMMLSLGHSHIVRHLLLLEIWHSLVLHGSSIWCDRACLSYHLVCISN